MALQNKTYDEKMRNLACSRFSGNSVRGRFMQIAYTFLMEREPITTVDLLATERNLSVKKYLEERPKPSLDSLYSELKNAMSDLKKLLEWKEGQGSLNIEKDAHNKQVSIYLYVGESDDPLADEILYSQKMVLEDYVKFCKSANGCMPGSLFNHFFHCDITRQRRSSNQQIQSEVNPTLRNIDLLPALFEAIHKRQVLRVRERPFVQPECDVLFHPQYLKEYNGRWFAFGYGIKDGIEPISTFNLPLDRIVEMHVTDDVEYIAAVPGFWDAYFKDIIGVTHGYYDGRTRIEEGVQTIVIRTHSVNCHNRVTTKMFHVSQKEVKPYGQHEDGEYGEITLTVEPNNELVGKILQMGTALEVMAPAELRSRITHDIEILLGRYK